MTRLDAQNLAALVLSLCASVAGAAGVKREAQFRPEQVEPVAQAILELTLPDGSRGIRDASEAVAPLRRYERIASTSLVADQVLFELCEPERVVAVTHLSKNSPRYGRRYTKIAGLESPADLEPILALHPDLLLSNHFGDPRYAARLREQGTVVFDLGDMGGLDSLLATIRVIGKLVSAEQRAERLAQDFVHELEAVAADVPQNARPRALYLAAYGKQLYGGAPGTSYHDVLTYAGTVDVTAGHYRGWPALDAEQVLTLDPDVLVTPRGMAQQLCKAPGLEALRPCGGEGRIVELDADLVDDPGLPMLELAESLRQQIHGPRSKQSTRP
ncbi:MAG: ABC transporter substrate-binding protein [Polyangiales bacterium]